jgi:hypothetical protein
VVCRYDDNTLLSHNASTTGTTTFDPNLGAIGDRNVFIENSPVNPSACADPDPVQKNRTEAERSICTPGDNTEWNTRLPAAIETSFGISESTIDASEHVTL